MKRLIRLITVYSAIVCLMTALCACGTQSLSDNAKGPDYNTLVKTGNMELEYASQYKVDYMGDYFLITIGNEQQFLLVPEECEIPRQVPEDITILKQPLENVYQVSSPIMDMIREIDALDHVQFTGTKKEDWYIEGIPELMEAGNLKYAGKYSQPDYELLLAGKCSLAIENTMIWHSPDAKEKLESLGIPVIVETASYEEHPLGRLEWIKLYGLLFGRMEEACQFFDTQIEGLEHILPDNQQGPGEEMEDSAQAGQKIAFFYVTSNGAVNVKKPGDYVAKIIEMAGGEYVPDWVDGQDETAMSAINMTLEDFYASAKDADIIVYNSTVVTDITSVDDLLKKSPLFTDFEAVKEGRVYCTGGNFYQQTTGVCYLIEDINKVLSGEEDGLFFLTHLQ